MNDHTVLPEAGTASSTAHPLLINGEWVRGAGATFAVLDKYRRTPGAYITTASRDQVAHAIGSAHDAFRKGVPSPFERGAVLERASALVEARLPDTQRTPARLSYRPGRSPCRDRPAARTPTAPRPTLGRGR